MILCRKVELQVYDYLLPAIAWYSSNLHRSFNPGFGSVAIALLSFVSLINSIPAQTKAERLPVGAPSGSQN